MQDRAGLPVVRTEKIPTPCDKPKIGCPKGHWSNPITLTADHRKILDLFEAVTVAGGSVLREAERNDEIVVFVLARLAEYRAARERVGWQSILTVLASK